MPLAGAWLLERWSQQRNTAIAAIGWAPVPLLAVVVFLIAASQVQTVLAALPVLGAVTGVFVIYLVLSVALGLWMGTRLYIGEPATRALALSFGTRNSFVVLPLSLALAPEWQAATVVIVFQSVGVDISVAHACLTRDGIDLGKQVVEQRVECGPVAGRLDAEVTQHRGLLRREVDGEPPLPQFLWRVLVSGKLDLIAKNVAVTFVTLDAASITAVAMVVRAHVQACFDNEAALKAEIEAATMADGIAALDLNTGWP